MEKLTWRLSEVKSFLEELIRYDEATEDEQRLYENYHWNGKMDTTSPTFKCILRKINLLYRGK